MDRYIIKIKIRGLYRFFFFFLIFNKPVVSQEFLFENNYITKATSGSDGSAYLIAVREDEVEEIQCKVSAETDEKYELSWLYDGFNATTSTTVTVGEVGAEYAVSNITVIIDNPEDIDNMEITCLKENGAPIGLEFGVFVKDPSIPCNPCNGTEYDTSTLIKLRRPGKQITQNQDILESLEKKLIQKYDYTKDGVVIDLHGNVCGCKKKVLTTTTTTTTTTTSTRSSPAAGNENSPWIIGVLFGVGVVLGSFFVARLGFKYWKRKHTDHHQTWTTLF